MLAIFGVFCALLFAPKPAALLANGFEVTLDDDGAPKRPFPVELSAKWK